VSNSRIKNVTFSESEDALLPPAASAKPAADQAPENQPAVSETDRAQEAADSAEDQGAAPAVAAESPVPLPAAPEGLKRVILSLEVTSSHYFDMEAFIETLEKQPRITKVDILTFEGLPELTSLDQKAEPLTFTLQVSAFYADGLQDLYEETPKVAAPQPSNKYNPLTPSLVTEDDE
jgi:type IV pilus assembly protein PilO